MAVHEENILCNICQKKFSSRSSLKRHTLLHKPELRKHYKCAICEKEFLQQSDLNFHFKTKHCSETMFQCSKCPNEYSSIKQLKIHDNYVHLNLEKYVCKDCDLKFGMPIILFRHRQKVIYSH